MHRIRASLAVGLNCPVSMELMVLRDTPTILASSPWDSFFSLRASFRRFFKMSASSMAHPFAAEDNPIRYTAIAIAVAALQSTARKI